MKKHEGMDSQSAHLDRGWDLLQKNDLDGARISAKSALADEPESPEARTLLGAVAAASGEEDEAMDHYQRAMDLDPDYVAPQLYAAELYLAPDREDFDEALKLVERALELSEEEDEYLDALLLKAEILVAMGDDDDGAKATLAELPPTRFPEAGFHLRAARSYLELELTDEAEDHYRQALELEADLADAYHGLGLAYEQRGDGGSMVKAFLKVRELDLEEAPVAWGLAEAEFERVAEEALAELPDRIRKLLENTPIVAADYPSIEIVAEGNDPRMMGFFSGVPYPEKSTLGSVPHLDCVFLYQRNIERMCRDRAEAAKEIRITLLHETGHFFGLSEEELDEMGLG